MFIFIIAIVIGLIIPHGHSTAHVYYIKPGLEMPKNTEWQKQISIKRVPDAFQSLPWSLQGRIVNKSSNIIKYSPEDGEH